MKCTKKHITTAQNSSNVIQNLKNTKIDENTEICSFDIGNMYTNIPTTEV
jgi:hypothetical protein